MLHTATLMAAMLLNQLPVRQCQTAASYSYSYTQPVQTYTQPAYNYQQNFVEKVLFLPIEREDPYYASIVHDKLRQEERAKEKIQGESDLAAQVNKLGETIASLEKRLAELAGVKVTTSTPQPPPPTQEPANPTPEPPPSPPTPAGPDSADVVKLKENVKKIFVDACAKCHTGESSAKGFVMFDDNDNLRDFLAMEKVLIDVDIHSGRMPKNSKPLGDFDYSQIRAWVGLDSNQIRKELIEYLNSKKGK